MHALPKFGIGLLGPSQVPPRWYIIAEIFGLPWRPAQGGPVAISLSMSLMSTHFLDEIVGVRMLMLARRAPGKPACMIQSS